jgi:hypothetical protein
MKRPIILGRVQVADLEVGDFYLTHPEQMQISQVAEIRLNETDEEVTYLRSFIYFADSDGSPRTRNSNRAPTFKEAYLVEPESVGPYLVSAAEAIDDMRRSDS